MTKTLRDKGLLIGWLAYAASFFLIAMVPTKNAAGLPGLVCAYLALVTSWKAVTQLMTRASASQYLQVLSVIIPGLINFVFAASVLRPNSMLLKIVLVTMIPFCWEVFYANGYQPREGHFVWIAGMLLIAFLSTGSTNECPQNERAIELLMPKS